ncbi:MCP four helix bundle domain-containing protein [Vibrio fluvialis]|uniref:MCP four helix bundle domain-containing protein n=1 Tax=Vibrio fluvialis TaxID=676 RepID=UPI0025745829|nr:MCP four helix bundle domain-containing protein [Vibrio fluvialis]BEI22786.1 hypothetical protein KKIDH5335_11180 [Vibrio fluvialis]
MVLRKINIGTRSVIAFGILTLISLCVGLFSLTLMSAMNNTASTIDKQWIPGLLDIQALSEDIARFRVESQRIRANDDLKVRAHSLQVIEDSREHIRRKLADIDTVVTDKGLRALFNGLGGAVNDYYVSLDDLINHINSDAFDNKIAVQLTVELAQKGISLQQHLNRLIQYNQTGVRQAVRQAQSTYHTATQIVLGAIVFAVVVNILLAVLFTKSLVLPIRRALETAKAIASGDLRHPVSCEHNDEAGELLRSMG